MGHLEQSQTNIHIIWVSEGERNKRVKAGVPVQLRMAAKNDVLTRISWYGNNNEHSIGYLPLQNDFHFF